MICQNCGKDWTNRPSHCREFLGKPMCKAWKQCYYRKTGKRIKPFSFPKRKMMSRADAIKYTLEANETPYVFINGFPYAV